MKRYGVIFTCMASRAVHLEVSNTLDTDSFINVLRRFIARRGEIKALHSDNGTNFVESNKELKLALQEMDQRAISSDLRCRSIDWIFNPPSASHMGGVWERVIRTVRKVLNGLLQEHGSRLEPLTPNHILTGKSCVTIAPPGVFQKEDLYTRRRWRRTQYLANLFWTRWRNEYLLLQQQRQK